MLSQLEQEFLGIPPPKNKEYSVEELGEFLDGWKTRTEDGNADAVGEATWLMLRRLLSSLRSAITEDLGSRAAVPTLEDRPQND